MDPKARPPDLARFSVLVGLQEKKFQQVSMDLNKRISRCSSSYTYRDGI